MLVADAARTVWRGGELFDAIVTDREREGWGGRERKGGDRWDGMEWERKGGDRWDGMGGAFDEIALT